MSTEHTPGPKWRIEGAAIIDDNNEVVCMVSSNPANAALIVHIPEMVERIKELEGEHINHVVHKTLRMTDAMIHGPEMQGTIDRLTAQVERLRGAVGRAIPRLNDPTWRYTHKLKKIIRSLRAALDETGKDGIK